jgi:hypothetical protein
MTKQIAMPEKSQSESKHFKFLLIALRARFQSLNALGTAVPSVILLRGEGMKSEWVCNPPRCPICQMTPKGTVDAQHSSAGAV